MRTPDREQKLTSVIDIKEQGARVKVFEFDKLRGREQETLNMKLNWIDPKVAARSNSHSRKNDQSEEREKGFKV